MAGEWRTVTLGEVIELKRGYDLPARDRHEGSFPIVSSSGISGHHAEAKVKAPGVVTGRYGTLGEVFFITDDFWPLNTALYVRDFKGNDPRFISYFLTTLNFLAYSDKAAVPGLNRNHLHSAPVQVPPLPEQRAIAHILGALDDKIELNRRMSATLEGMARALFQSWFVDFDPVRAKLALSGAEGARGEQPAGLTPEIAALFPNALVETELGAAPVGWEVGTLGSVARQVPRTVRPDQLDPSTPYIGLEHMPKQSIALSLWGFAEGIASNKSEFRTGEFLFGKLRPYFHKVGIAPCDGVCSTDIVVVVPESTSWFGFVLGHISGNAFVEYTNAHSTGTKMPRTNWADMARYPIIVPSVAIACAYTNQIKPICDRIIANIHEAAALAALRDALLPRLISGQLRVADAERIAGRSI
jgi:type I restriction enzyme S subunit